MENARKNRKKGRKNADFFGWVWKSPLKQRLQAFRPPAGGGEGREESGGQPPHSKLGAAPIEWLDRRRSGVWPLCRRSSSPGQSGHRGRGRFYPASPSPSRRTALL